MIRFRSLALAALPVVALTTNAFAAPIYPVDSGSITYVNSFLGFGLSDSFHFTGPLVSIMGSGATAVAYSNMPSLGVPFPFSLNLVIDDTGDESGPAMANGVNYASVQYTGNAAVAALMDVTLTSGNLTVSVPAAVTGSLLICDPSSACAGGGGTPTFPFSVSFNVPGTLTLTFAQFNLGSTYTLTNAQFTSAVPEPASWLCAAGGLALLLAARQRFLSRRRRIETPHAGATHAFVTPHRCA